MELINQIIIRMNKLGYPADSYFPELKKIINIIANSEVKELSYIHKKIVVDCSRRIYELGITDSVLDNLMDQLYRKTNRSPHKF